MPTVRQTSFAAGELSPLLRAHTDLAKHSIGLQTCRNFFISRLGAAVSRPGIPFLGKAKFSGASFNVRLVPFVFSSGDALVLEFGDQYIRFWLNGALVGGGSPVEVSTPYARQDLYQLKFVQVGNTITITHKSYPPKELQRVSNTTWTFGSIVFDLPAATLGGSAFTAALTGKTHYAAYSAVQIYSKNEYVSYNNVLYLSVAAPNLANTPDLPDPWSSVVSYAADALVDRNGAIYRSLTGNGNLNQDPVSATSYWQPYSLGQDYWWQPVGQVSAFPQWTWVVTALAQLPSGIIRETAAVTASVGSFPCILDAQHPATITVSAGAPGAGYAVWGYKIYRGINNVFGLVGTLNAAGAFTDDGTTPDYTQPPPQGANPFVSVAPGSGKYIWSHQSPPPSTSDYPACAAFFENRRCFFSTPGRPAYAFGGEVGNYYNFDDVLLKVESSPFLFELSSRFYTEVRSVVALQKLVLFCNSGVWSLSGTNGPLTFNNVDAKIQTDMGASWLTPLVVEDSILYARAKGTGVRNLIFDIYQQKFSVADVSLLAEHLFTNHQVVDWCYAEDPWSLVWAVREDGQLLSLTYAKDQEVSAWAHHDSPELTFESVCSIPNGTVDDVYVSAKITVSGTTWRYIGRLADRVVTEDTHIHGFVGLDMAIEQISGSPTTAVTGLSHLEGKEVYALADGLVQGPFTVASGSITLTTDATIVQVGLTFTPQLKTLPIALQGVELRAKTKTISQVAFEVYASRGLAVGPDFDNLEEWDQVEVSDEFDPPTLFSDLVKMAAPTVAGYAGESCLQQNWPLPVTVTAFSRDFQVGDD